MTLLNPIWLWGLGGLAIPLAIHLLSRKEGKTIRIGSIRFLAETATSKFSSIRLNEVALLAVRCLLIGLLVLFLASVFVSSTNTASQKWVVVEKGLENDTRIKNLLDSLQKDGYEVHRLAAGFPETNTDTISQFPDYYRLSEALSQRSTIEAVVIARNRLSNFKGKRISLPNNVTWLSYPVTPMREVTDTLRFPADSVRITIAYDKEFQYDKKILVASLRALQTETGAKLFIDEIETGNLQKNNSQWLIWLSTNALTYEGKSLRFKQDPLRDLIVQESRNTWALTKRVNEENAVEHHLTIQLMNMLFTEHRNEQITKQDNRTLSDELAWAGKPGATTINQLQAGQPADKILILLILLTFLTERVLAFYRKQ